MNELLHSDLCLHVHDRICLANVRTLLYPRHTPRYALSLTHSLTNSLTHSFIHEWPGLMNGSDIAISQAQNTRYYGE